MEIFVNDMMVYGDVMGVFIDWSSHGIVWELFWEICCI